MAKKIIAEKKVALRIKCKRNELEKIAEEKWNELCLGLVENENPVLTVPAAGLSREITSADELKRGIKCDCKIPDCWFVKIEFVN